MALSLGVWAVLLGVASAVLTRYVDEMPFGSSAVSIIPYCSDGEASFHDKLVCAGTGYSQTAFGLTLKNDPTVPQPTFDTTEFCVSMANSSDYLTSLLAFQISTGFPVLDIIAPNISMVETICSLKWAIAYQSYNACVQDEARLINFVPPTPPTTDEPIDCTNNIYCFDPTAKALGLQGNGPFVMNWKYWKTADHFAMLACQDGNHPVYQFDGLGITCVTDSIHTCTVKKFANYWHCFSGVHQVCDEACDQNCVCYDAAQKRSSRSIAHDMLSNLKAAERNFRIRASTYSNVVTCGQQMVRGNCVSMSFSSSSEMQGTPSIVSSDGSTGSCTSYVCAIIGTGMISCSTKCCIKNSPEPHFVTLGSAKCAINEELNFQCMYTCSGGRCTLDAWLYAQTFMETTCAMTGSIKPTEFYVFSIVLCVLLSVIVICYYVWNSKILNCFCNPIVKCLKPVSVWLFRIPRYILSIIIGFPLSVVMSPVLLLCRASICDVRWSIALRNKPWYWVFIWFVIDVWPTKSAALTVSNRPSEEVWDQDIGWLIQFLQNSTFWAVICVLVGLMVLRIAVVLLYRKLKANRQLNPNGICSLSAILALCICLPEVSSALPVPTATEDIVLVEKFLAGLGNLSLYQESMLERHINLIFVIVMLALILLAVLSERIKLSKKVNALVGSLISYYYVHKTDAAPVPTPIVVEDPSISWYDNFPLLVNQQIKAIFCAIAAVFLIVTVLRLLIAFYINCQSECTSGQPKCGWSCWNFFAVLCCFTPAAAAKSADFQIGHLHLDEIPVSNAIIFGLCLAALTGLINLRRCGAKTSSQRYTKRQLPLLRFRSIRLAIVLVGVLLPFQSVSAQELQLTYPAESHWTPNSTCDASTVTDLRPWNGSLLLDTRLSPKPFAQNAFGFCFQPQNCDLTIQLNALRKPMRKMGNRLNLVLAAEQTYEECLIEGYNNMLKMPGVTKLHLVINPSSICCKSVLRYNVLPSTVLSFTKGELEQFKDEDYDEFTLQIYPYDGYPSLDEYATLRSSHLYEHKNRISISTMNQWSKPYKASDIEQFLREVKPISMGYRGGAMFLYMTILAVFSVIFACGVWDESQYVCAIAIMSIVWWLMALIICFADATIVQGASATEPFFVTSGLVYSCKTASCRAQGAVKFSLDANRADTYSIILQHPEHASQSLVLSIKILPPVITSEYQTVRTGYSNIQVKTMHVRRCHFDAGYDTVCALTEAELVWYKSELKAGAYFKFLDQMYETDGGAAHGCFSLGQARSCRGFLMFSQEPDVEQLRHVSTKSFHRIEAWLMSLEDYKSRVSPRGYCSYNKRFYGSKTSFKYACDYNDINVDPTSNSLCCASSSACQPIPPCVECRYPFEADSVVPCPQREEIVTGRPSELCIVVTTDIAKGITFYYCPLGSSLQVGECSAWQLGVPVKEGSEIDTLSCTAEQEEGADISIMKVTRGCSMCPYDAQTGTLILQEGQMSANGHAFEVQMAGTVTHLSIEQTLNMRGDRTFIPTGGCDQFMFSAPGDYSGQAKVALERNCWDWVYIDRHTSAVEFRGTTTTTYQETLDDIALVQTYPASYSEGSETWTVTKNVYHMNRTATYNGLMEMVVRLHNWTYAVSNSASEVSTIACHSALYCQACNSMTRLSIYYSAACSGKFAEVLLDGSLKTLLICGDNMMEYLTHNINIGEEITMTTGSVSTKCPVVRIAPETEPDNPLGDIVVSGNDDANLGPIQIETWVIIISVLGPILGVGLVVGAVGLLGGFTSCGPFCMMCCTTACLACWSRCCSMKCKNLCCRQHGKIVPLEYEEFKGVVTGNGRARQSSSSNSRMPSSYKKKGR